MRISHHRHRRLPKTTATNTHADNLIAVSRLSHEAVIDASTLQKWRIKLDPERGAVRGTNLARVCCGQSLGYVPLRAATIGTFSKATTADFPPPLNPCSHAH